jgi:peptidoglycan/xylan/chitin deacetylase (PgdA/CDA1 family)
MIQGLNAQVLTRAQSGVRRALATRLHRRALTVAPVQPLVSFSFDDAPSSAFETGARVLERHGVRGTYYVSLGLLGQPGPSGPLGGAEALRAAVAAGHELGCHTHDHLDAWQVSAGQFLASVEANAQALQRLLPGHRFETFAYPKSGAVAAVKPALAKRFLACRHGGQRGNSGRIDRDLLAACFLDRQQHADLSFVRNLLEDNARTRGWLIFATHDVTPDPSPWGCTPGLLEAVVRHALRTGSRILPVREALRAARC